MIEPRLTRSAQRVLHPGTPFPAVAARHPHPHHRPDRAGPVRRAARTACLALAACVFLHRGSARPAGLRRAGCALRAPRGPCRADARAPAGHFGPRGQFVPPYARIKARRTPRGGVVPPLPVLWTP